MTACNGQAATFVDKAKGACERRWHQVMTGLATRSLQSEGNAQPSATEIETRTKQMMAKVTAGVPKHSHEMDVAHLPSASRPFASNQCPKPEEYTHG